MCFLRRCVHIFVMNDVHSLKNCSDYLSRNQTIQAVQQVEKVDDGTVDDLIGAFSHQLKVSPAAPLIQQPGRLLRASDANLNRVGPVVVWSCELTPAEFDSKIDSDLDNFEAALDATFFPGKAYVTSLTYGFTPLWLHSGVALRTPVWLQSHMTSLPL